MLERQYCAYEVHVMLNARTIDWTHTSFFIRPTELQLRVSPACSLKKPLNYFLHQLLSGCGSLFIKKKQLRGSKVKQQSSTMKKWGISEERNKQRKTVKEISSKTKRTQEWKKCTRSEVNKTELRALKRSEGDRK